MNNIIKQKLLPFFISIAIPFAIGGLSAFFTNSNMELYKNLNLPAAAPPSIVFPIAWSILYLFMGISSYLIYRCAPSPQRSSALCAYGIQLAINFIWPLLFFNLQWYSFSFVWLVLLLIMVIYMITQFYPISKAAAWLNFPYVLWLLFAGWLNLFVVILN